MLQFANPFDTVELERIPDAGKQPLRAWDAADELLLETLASENLPGEGARLLLVNDQFAALACALNKFSRTVYSDSFLTQLALSRNQDLNAIQRPAEFLPSTQTPLDSPSLVIIKIPKALSLLEHQLATLKPLLTTGTRIIAAGMVKYLQKSHIALLERYLGSTTTSLARKKARLVFVNELNADTNPSPFPSHYLDPISGLRFANHANVFSRAKPDQGSQLMVRHFSKLAGPDQVIDMGCGNGMLGINLKIQLPSIRQLSFVDESFMALASTKQNYCAAFGNASGAEFIASNCFEQVPPQSTDLILCNPPFHQANTVGDHIAWAMISQSKNCLVRGGVLCLVGNRHLNYHSKIKHLYGNVEVLASDRKFVVLAAIKQ